MANYLKLHRKMLNWGWYGDTNTTRLFLHILLSANWLPGECYGIRYEAGEFVTSLDRLSKETNLSFSQVRTALKHMEMTGEITSTSHGKCRVITVNNWCAYQASDKDDRKEIARKSQEDSNEIATELEIKNKEIKNKRFIRPTVDEVRAFCQEKGYDIDPERFVDFYESKGWLVGKTPMKDWKAAARGWQSRQKETVKKPEQKKNNFKGDYERSYDEDFYKTIEEEQAF